MVRVLYGRMVRDMTKKISEEDYEMIVARRNLQKGIFIPESVKTLHHMKGLKEKIGCYDSYVYAERLYNSDQTYLAYDSCVLGECPPDGV